MLSRADRYPKLPSRLLERLLALFLAVFAFVLAVPAHGSVRTVCGVETSAHEKANRLPPGLAYAIALAESGRWLADDQATKPWPWTVTSGSDSFYLPTKEAAIAKVRELKSAGRTNIDVGCMQINLHYHPKAFDSLEEAFDPATNIAYGVKFLKDLRMQTRSWGKATAFYHSQNRARGNAYRNKVYKFWRQQHRERVLRGRRSSLAMTDGEAKPQPLLRERIKRPLVKKRFNPLWKRDAIPTQRGGVVLRGG